MICWQRIPEISRQARVFLNGEEIAKYFYSGEAADFAQALRSPWSILHERYAEILDDRIPQIAAAAKERRRRGDQFAV